MLQDKDEGVAGNDDMLSLFFPFLFLLPFTLLIIHVFLLVSSIYKHPFLFSNRQSRIVFFCF